MKLKAFGHANLATMQIYTHIVDEELEGALEFFRTARTLPEETTNPIVYYTHNIAGGRQITECSRQ